MALTRAQLLQGNTAEGIILANTPQGVRPGGAGITIAPDGVISVNSQTTIGLMKLGQTPAAAAAAYNGYTWPIGPGTPGQQLESDGVGNLFWADADGIDWTLKGQLIVGTGVSTDTLLDAGPDNQVLKTSSGTTSGLIWSDLYVDVVPNITGAAVIPKGTTAQRPPAPLPGYLRLNQDFTQPDRLEVWDGDGATWRQLAYVEPVRSFGPYSATTNQSVAGTIFCDDFNISSGVTVTVEGALFVYCTGNVVISGTLNADAKGPLGARNYTGTFPDNSTNQLGSGLGIGGAATRFGGNVYNVAVTPTGSGGSTGFVGNTQLSNQVATIGPAGSGGGSIIIRCLNDITVTGGIITANGGNAGTNTPNNCNVSGAGGGSGGTIILDANRDLTLNGANITVNGGNGAAGGNGGGAGGGGGGGYIITQARYGVLNVLGATVRTANGGNPGAPTGTVNIAGAGGGSNAGRGGWGQTGVAIPLGEGGGIGSVSNFGSIYSLPNS